MKFSAQRILGIALALLFVGAIVYAFLPKAVPVDLAPVARGSLEVTVNENGKTRIKERYIVSAPLAGRMLRVELHPGDAVKAGTTILALMEPTDPVFLDVRAKAEADARVKAAMLAMIQAQAKVNRAREVEEMARHDFERVAKLRASKSTSGEEYDNAEHKLGIAKEDQRIAEFGVQIATYEVEIARAAFLRTQPGKMDGMQFEIRSPIDGVVLRVLQESAGIIPSGTRILELGDPNDLEVEVDVLSTDAVKIRPGARARLEHWGGEHPLAARVRLVEPAGFLKVSALGVEEQRVNVILDLLDPRERRKSLGDAFRVEARIVVWEGSDILKVPAGALFRRQDTWAVFVAEAGRARLRPVQIGPSDGLVTEVVGGLKQSEQVILHPSDKIRDGVAVIAR